MIKKKIVYGGGGFLYALGVLAVVFMSGVATLGNYLVPKSQFDVGSRAALPQESFNHYWVPPLELPDSFRMEVQPADRFLAAEYRMGQTCSSQLAKKLMAEANVSFMMPLSEGQELVCQALTLQNLEFYFITQKTRDNHFLLVKDLNSAAQVVLRTSGEYPSNMMRVKGSSQEIVVLQEGDNNPAKTLVITIK